MLAVLLKWSAMNNAFSASLTAAAAVGVVVVVVVAGHYPASLAAVFTCLLLLSRVSSVSKRREQDHDSSLDSLAKASYHTKDILFAQGYIDSK